MAFNVTQFRSSFRSTDAARAAHFDVIIAPPRSQGNQGAGGIFGTNNPLRDFIESNSTINRVLAPIAGLAPQDMMRRLNFRAKSTDMPGKNMTTLERNTYGPVRKVGVTAEYQDLRIEFICGDDYAERDFFEEWQRYVVDNASHDAGYYDNYISTIILNQYDALGTVTLSTEFKEAYPVAISSANLDWGSSDTMLTFQVDFAYHRYSMTKNTPSLAEKIIKQVGGIATSGIQNQVPTNIFGF